MRIGINVLWLVPGMTCGAETYVRGLLSGLAAVDADNEYVLFTNRDNHASFEGLPPNFRRRLFDFSARWSLLSLTMTRLVGEQIFLPWACARERLTLLHAPLDIVPLAARCPIVLTLHDVNFGAVHETGSPAAHALGERLVRASARRADAILTVSHFSRREICRALREPAPKVRVVYNAPARRPQPPQEEWPRLRGRLGLCEPYLLAMSSQNAHKNVGQVIRAFARLPSAARRRLVVCGHLPRGGTPLPELSRRLGVSERVVFTGYLRDAELRLVLEHARALAFASLYEGFGVPVVEAMAAGVPVACSTAASLPEVAGRAALFFDPRDADELAERLERLMLDEGARRELAQAGRLNARRFSWEEAARRTLEAYRLAAAGLPVSSLELKAPAR